MADFGPAGPHPVIVVSREELNRGHYASSARRRGSLCGVSCRTACRFERGISGSPQTVLRNARTSSPLIRYRSTWRRVRWAYWMPQLFGMSRAGWLFTGWLEIQTTERMSIGVWSVFRRTTAEPSSVASRPRKTLDAEGVKGALVPSHSKRELNTLRCSPVGLRGRERGRALRPSLKSGVRRGARGMVGCPCADRPEEWAISCVFL